MSFYGVNLGQCTGNISYKNKTNVWRVVCGEGLRNTPKHCPGALTCVFIFLHGLSNSIPSESAKL